MKATCLFIGRGERERTPAGSALRWGTAGVQPGAGGLVQASVVEFSLEREFVWRMVGPLRGVRVHCAAGQLWITQEGASADVILRPGQSFLPAETGAMVVQAIANGGQKRFADGLPNEANWGAPPVCLLTIAGETAPALALPERRRAVTNRIGFDLVEGDRGRVWESAVFALLCLCGLAAIGYCLTTLLGLEWNPPM